MQNPPTPWGPVCESYVSPPLSFPSPLRPKTSVIYDSRGGGVQIFFLGGAQAPWGQVGSIFAGGRYWNPFGCVLGASWSLVGVLRRGFGALGFDFGGLWAFPKPKGVGGMAEPLNFNFEDTNWKKETKTKRTML